ncbi:MAG: penicillin-binding protein 1C [Proteobacteria bacterium]|nr:penicillin-binding protein 1C [Pseudomonadota bacterium]
MWLKGVLWSGICLAVIMVAGALLLAKGAGSQRPPSYETVKHSYEQSDALLLDRHGEVIHQIRVDEKGRRLEWASLNSVSPAFTGAVLFVEDKRFYQHHGVDWFAMGASVLKNLGPKRLRGASTITMQLAAALDKRLKPKGARRGIRQKWQQICAAIAIEKQWSKEQILEAYINLISYRGELQGITAASRGLFHKEPGGLNDEESFILAALITSPNAPMHSVIKKACAYEKSSKGTVCESTENRFAEMYSIKPVASLAPHVAYRLLKGEKGKIVSTIDGKLQRYVSETLRHYLAQLKTGNVSDGAVLVVHNRTGEILAYVGNSGPSSSAPHVDGIQARRQAGSTLKPFLYGLAIEKGLLTPASLLEDSPLHVTTPTGLYVPQNYDNTFRGSVSVRTALSASLNVPAVRTLLLVGLVPFVERLKRTGFESLTEEAEYYGYSIALGSADITLFELVNAYRTLANKGMWSEPKLTMDGKTKKPAKVFNTDTAFVISHILSDREARSATFGLENPLSTRFWTAVKTGTSKDMRDNWCVGYSDIYTVGVWVGNFSGEPMRNVSGITGAAPVWLEVMNYLHDAIPSTPPKPPSGVVLATLSYHHDIEPSRQEYFLKDTEPRYPVRINTLHQKPGIVYPADETLVALDPEIPEELQRVPFRFQPESHRYEWVLNKAKTGHSDHLFLWKPERGKYELCIVDREDRIVDSVEFVVR